MKSTLKIVAGGQTGVDRAALEWALANGIPHGGWCPKGRKAEDGVIPPQFQLRETGSDNYSIRTRRNVRDSGGTVIFSKSADLTGGTKETAEFAKEIGKPLLKLVSSAGKNRSDPWFMFLYSLALPGRWPFGSIARWRCSTRCLAVCRRC